MTFKHYVNCIDSGFLEKYDLEVFIKTIEGDGLYNITEPTMMK